MALPGSASRSPFLQFEGEFLPARPHDASVMENVTKSGTINSTAADNG